MFVGQRQERGRREERGVKRQRLRQTSFCQEAGGVGTVERGHPGWLETVQREGFRGKLYLIKGKKREIGNINIKDSYKLTRLYVL